MLYVFYLYIIDTYFIIYAIYIYNYNNMIHQT